MVAITGEVGGVSVGITRQQHINYIYKLVTSWHLPTGLSHLLPSWSAEHRQTLILEQVPPFKQPP